MAASRIALIASHLNGIYLFEYKYLNIYIFIEKKICKRRHRKKIKKLKKKYKYLINLY